MKSRKKYRLKENIQKGLWKTLIGIVSIFMVFTTLDSTFTQDLFAANANITFDTKVLNNVGTEGTETSDVQSGQPFYLQVNYQFSTAGDGVTYGTGNLQIVKPEGAVFDLQGTEELLRMYPTVFTSVQQRGNQIIFNTDEGTSIPAGTSANLYAKFYYANFTTLDGYGAAENEQFRQIQYTGSLNTATGTQDIEPINIPNITVTNHASEPWSISKTSDGYTTEGTQYIVTYNVYAGPDDGDRYGRLNCDPFTLTDFLPKKTTGELDPDTKKMIGYPEGGGAQNIVSIVRNYGEVSNKVLTTEDYSLTYNNDNSIESIVFNDSAFDKSNGATMIDDGHLMGTSFQIKVAYPLSAYEIENNETSFDAYHLLNTAQLIYQPLGKDAQSIDANAPVDLGWKDENAGNHDFVIQKQVKVGTNDLIGEEAINDFTKDFQDIYYTGSEKIAFTLYKDEACTKVATNWDGTVAAGKEQSIDELGQVSFKELLAGTYYLKETSTITGFTEQGVKKITIAKDGTISVDGDILTGNEISIINETNSDGFGYVAFWKMGTSAASSVGHYLSGVTFTLKQKNGTKEYTETSDDNGMVLFKGIPAGSYVLNEVEKADSEFLPLDKSYTVTVLGNQVNYPKEDGKELQKDDNKPYITNTSNKGSLRIIKIDSKNKETIQGAEFVAYGPYLDESQVKKEEEKKHEIGTEYTDGSAYYALEPGYYLIEETKAPAGYTKSEESFVKKIELNTTLELTVENKPVGSLIIEKQGQLKLTGVDQANWPKVALLGAEFTLYTDADHKTVAKDINGNDAVIKQFSISDDKATSQDAPLYLDEGTYYIRETKVPTGYVAMDDTTITIKSGEKLVESYVNTADTLGRIHIVKKDAKTEKVLSGAEFKITNNDTKESFTQKVNAQGELTTGFLPKGTYTIEETKTPAGYYDAGFKKTDVEVTNNTQVEVEVWNEPLVSYSLKKVDATDTNKIVSNGVTFKLYKTKEDAQSDKNVLDSKSASAAGIITFVNLIPGQTYYYKETKTNNDYTLDSTVKEFTTPNKDNKYEQKDPEVVTNVHKGNLRITKQSLKLDSDSEYIAVSGIQIRIYPKDSDSFENNSKNKSYTRTTDVNGIAEFKQMEAGDYWVQELSLGGNGQYSTFEPFVVTIDPWSGYGSTPWTEKKVINEYEKGKVEVEKTSSLDSSVKLSATFGIYRTDDKEFKNPIDTFKTDAKNGIGTSHFIPTGNYVLKEISVDKKEDIDYVVDQTAYPITIEAGKTTKLGKAITNEPYGGIVIEKYELWNLGDSSQTQFPLAGIEFLVYELDDAGKENLYTTVTSTATGVTVNKLKPGKTYRIRENMTVKQKELYTAVTAYQDVTIVAGTISTIKFDNTPNMGKIKIVKKDKDTNALLNGAKFDVYVEDATGDTTITVGDKTIMVKKVQSDVETGTAYQTGAVVDDGVAYTKFLEDGSIVYLKETKAPNGYIASNVWSGPYTVENGKLVVAEEFNYTPQTGVGTKTNADGTSVLSGAKVGLFTDKTKAEFVNNVLSGKDTSITIENLLKALEDPNSGYTMVSSAESGSDGALKFKNINKNTSYYAVELSAPKNFIRADDVFTVKAVGDKSPYKLHQFDKNGNDSGEFKLANDQYGQFKLKKIATLSDQEYLLNNVRFQIYQSKNGLTEGEITETEAKANITGDPIEAITGTSTGGANGEFLSGYLKPGWYIFQENQDASKQPNHITVSPTYYAVHITKNEINTHYFDNPISNSLTYGQFVLNKVSAQDHNIAVQAFFKLEKQTESGKYEIVKGMEEFEVNKREVYQSDFLPTGHYRLTEVKVENGYTLNTTPVEFDIAAGKVTGMKNGTIAFLDKKNIEAGKPFKDYPIIVENNQQGSIELVKKGKLMSTDTETVLGGITFKLYRASGNYETDIKEKEIAITTTGADGKIAFTNIDAGSYWLVETDVDGAAKDNGYVANQYFMVTVTAGQTATTYEGAASGSNEIINNTTYGKLSITKKDANSADKLAGAVFGVYSDLECKNEVDSITTDGLGSAVSKLLPAGSYYLKEKTAPTGYFKNETVYGPVTVTAQTVSTAIEITNDKIQKAAIKKVDSKTKDDVSSEAIKTAEFALYDNTAASGTPLQTIKGTLVFDNLKPNTTYWVKETTAPDGYVLDGTIHEVTTDNTGVKEVTIENAPYGSIRIEKKAQWSLDGSGGNKFDLDGAEFTLYDSDQTTVLEAKTSENGAVTFRNLKAGTYYIEESKAPDGFTADKDKTGKQMVEVTMGEENTSFTGDQCYVNYPDKAKFKFTKTAVDKTILKDAEFKLQKSENGNYTDVEGYQNIALDARGSYESGLLDEGSYRLIETKADEHFSIMDPIDFKLTTANITTVTTDGKDSVVNESKGNIELYKYSDEANYDLNDGSKQPLKGAVFTLYENDGSTPVKDADGKPYTATSNEDGKTVWVDIDPGTYKIKETQAPEGYAENTAVYTVTVAAGKSSVETYHPNEKEIINLSNAGRLLVQKTDKDGKALAGAVFEIYTVIDEKVGVLVDTITTGQDGYASSKLLEATKDGTPYFVKEIKTPDGYTLDEQYGKLTAIVKVLPIHDIELIKTNCNKDQNCANFTVFKNTSYGSYEDNDINITKKILDNGTEKDMVEASKSLLESTYDATYILRDFAKKYNSIPVKDVTISDVDMKYWYYQNSDEKNKVNEPIENDSYQINSITLYQAAMKGDSAINALVQYQESGDSTNTWRDFTGNELKDLQNGNQTIDVSMLNAKHFRVIYTAAEGEIQPEFETMGIDFDVTYAKRASDATKHEIREITNQAEVVYGYTVKDQDGTDKYEMVSEKSNETIIKLPLLNQGTPYVDVSIAEDSNSKKPFNPGESVYYTITVENLSSDSGVAFEQPIVSFDLPVGMTLNDFYKTFDSQFLILLGSPESSTTIDMSEVDMIQSETNAKIMDQNGDYVETGKKTTKVTMTFKNLKLFSKSAKLYIKFAGEISIDNPSTTGLLAPVYLNSAKEILLSAENPYGNSFHKISEGTMVADEDLDQIIDKETTTGDGKKYVYNNVEINVAVINNMNIYKRVKGQYNDDYMGPNNIASTAPSGDIDYKIVLTDGESDQQVSKVRIVDILPFKVDSGKTDADGNPIYYQDTFVNRNNAGETVLERTTTLTKRAIYNGGLSVTGPDGSLMDPSQYTVYYCVSDGDSDAEIVDEWIKSEREKNNATTELPMLYDNMEDGAWNRADSPHTWTTKLPEDLSKITAIGVEVNFGEALMAKGGSVTVDFKMTAPLYATDELEEVKTGLIVNSAMGAVERVNQSSDKIKDNDRIENDPVKIRISLAKGSIGDYAFYDINRNGVQDEIDVPVAGLRVKLHQIKKTKDGTTETITETLTDQAGYYLFDNLDCNNIIDEEGNKDDPNNYVGGSIYTYWVEFATPSDESANYHYTPTILNAVEDVNVDSNIKAIDATRNETDPIQLVVEELEDGTLIGEDNMSIDAGFVVMGALGDYVWIDDNRNGIQDTNERGVANVAVRLYQPDEEGVIKEPIAETTTDINGYYIFNDLIEGKYVVEFDITDVDSKGYSPYCFTKALQESNRESDSNAIPYGQSGTIARSEVIELGYRGHDMSIDAGLIYYSALSGYAFEDRDYSDLQDHAIADIPLPGTIVELYRVNDNTREEDPIQTTTVGEDGKYFFDQLIEGDYQVKFTFPKGYSAVNPHMGDDTIDSDVSEEWNDSSNSGYTPIITIAPNSLETHWDGGARVYGSIGDYVWDDTNKNGIQDRGESPIANVPVYLQERVDGGDWRRYGETTTNENGYYLFDNLKGTTYTDIEYRVIFGFSGDTKITTPLAGDDVEDDSNALADYILGWGFPTNTISLGYGQHDMTWDAGIIHTSASVGDYVWYDTNKNGLQDEENTGIANIIVILERNNSDDLNDDGWMEIGKTKTNNFGYYRFDDLEAGYYRVKFKVGDYTVTLSNVSDNAAIDSDGLIEAGDWYLSRPFYLEEDGFDMTWDCGVYDKNGSKDIINKYPGSYYPPTGDHTNPLRTLLLLIGGAGLLGISNHKLRKLSKKAK